MGFDSGDLAGMSAALAYYFVASTVGFGYLIWRYRARYRLWKQLSQRDQADALLQIGMFGVILNAAFQRIIATYSFAVQEWRMSPVTIWTAPIYLIWSLFFIACILWWVCLEVFGPSRNLVWWLSIVIAGAWIGSAVSWRY